LRHAPNFGSGAAASVPTTSTTSPTIHLNHSRIELGCDPTCRQPSAPIKLGVAERISCVRVPDCDHVRGRLDSPSDELEQRGG
jgi:hypothetical protein